MAVLIPLSRALRNAVRTQEGLPELPDAQAEVIRALPTGTVLSSSELAERLGLSRATVSNLLTAMEAKGLVVRRPSAVSQRQVEVLATAPALALFERFDQAGGAMIGAAAATLSPEDRAALEHARSAVAAALPALERLREALQRTKDGS